MKRALLALVLVGCRSRAHPAVEAGAPDATIADAAIVDASVVDAADAAPPLTERDAAACTPMRVLAVHTSVSFQFGVTSFEGQLRAHGKTKSYTAFHPALELRDKGAKKPTKHYLPQCNFAPETGGVPCHDFDACVEPAPADAAGLPSPPMLACRGKEPLLFRWTEEDGALAVLQAKPGETSWTPLLTIHPEGGCVSRQPDIVRVERTLALNE